MSVVQFTAAVSASIRMATGEDEKAIYAIRAKIEPLLTERGDDMEELVQQDQFAACMVCTDWIKGIDFPILKGDAPAEQLRDLYLAWLKLPRRIWIAWRYAPETVDDAFNAADLLPPEFLGRDQRNDPLPLTAETSNGGI